jgi:ubiquinone/menaquinone biosynthesis C-methylase UbiE
MRRAEGARELMDGPLPAADLTASLDDLDRLNRWFGGYALTLRVVRAAAATVPHTRPMVVVDVGGGRGDFARHCVRWARRARRPARVIVVDRDTAGVRHARASACPEIVTIVADATALPLREGAADVVTCSLTLHHLDEGEAVAALADMATVARGDVIVNDLRRGYLSLVLVWLATRLLRMHRVSRHDGPLSVRRSYSTSEIRALAEKAGFQHIAVAAYPALARVMARLS